MKRIWKFSLMVTPRQTLMVPAGAQFLKVRAVGSSGAFAWAIIDPTAEQVELEITMNGTGHDLQEHETKENHIGTIETGAFVWHFFIVPA